MSLISRDITKRKLISLSVLLTSVMLGCGSDSQQRVDPSQSQVPNQQGGIINPTNVHMPTQAILSPTSTPINHPLILEFTPAPINNPDLEQTPDPTLPYVPKLPADEFPALVQSVNSAEFKGLFEATGSVSINQETITFTGTNGEKSLIVFRLPDLMQALSDRTFPGKIRLKDQSDIASVERETWIYDDDGLVFSEIWKTSEEPIGIGITNDIALIQSSVDETQTSRVPTQLIVTGNAQSSVIPLPTSIPVSVTTVAGEFQVFLENSAFRSISPNATDGFSAYNTHVWVIRN